MTSPIAPSCFQALVSKTIKQSGGSAKISSAVMCSPRTWIDLDGSMNVSDSGVGWALMMWTDLPIDSSTSFMPSSLPNASQSGRICETRMKESCERTWSANDCQSTVIGAG